MQRLSAEKRKLISDLMQNGVAAEEIAKKANVSIKTVIRTEQDLKYGANYAAIYEKLPLNFESEWNKWREIIICAFENGTLKRPICLISRG